MFSGKGSAQTNPTPQSIPYAQDFGNDYFSVLPAGFAAWNATGAPISSLATATTNSGKSDQSLDTAQVPKTVGDVYGYSGITSGVPNLDGELYIQTSSDTTSGTCQVVLSINTTGYRQLSISYDIDMINPQPKTIGIVFSYRVGNTGAWTSISQAYNFSSTNRTAGTIDSYSWALPAACENQPEVQLRWSSARGTTAGNSSGAAIDNILVNGRLLSASPLHYRSVTSGNWQSPSTWESSPDRVTWLPATVYPTNFDSTITIRYPHVVTTSGLNSLVIDQTTVDTGATLWNAIGTALGINDQSGSVDLIINGTFIDSSLTSVVFNGSATWQMGAVGTLVKATSSSGKIWQLKHSGSITTIPATSNWICRKYAQSPYDPPLSSTNNGPPNPQASYGNLYIENYTATWNMYTNPRFTGALNFPNVKGNLYIGGNGTGPVDFLNNNTNVVPATVAGNIVVNAGCSIQNLGTGIQVKGNVVNNGTISSIPSNSLWLFSGAAPQSISGSGTFSTGRLQVNNTGGDLTISQPVLVNGSLTFTQGRIFTSMAYPLALNDNATTTGASNTSFVHGPMKKFGDDSFTFPVGKGNDIQTIGMLNVSAVKTPFWFEYFNNSCASGCLATSYVANGAWTETATGNNGASANAWYVSYSECGSAPGACQSQSCANPNLHIGPSVGTPDARATYSDGGAATITNKRIESPTINCTGRGNVMVEFNFIKGGIGSSDNVWMVYYNGSTWSRIADLTRSLACASPTTSLTWTNARFSLPASSTNNPSIKIGFEWDNNGNSDATTVSFAVDSIRLIDQSDLFTAEYFHVDPFPTYTTVCVASLHHISRCEYWTLTRDFGTASKKVILSYDANSCGIVDSTKLRVARWSTTLPNLNKWVDEGVSLLTGSNLAGAITSNATSGFGAFTLSTTTPVNPLPISLLYFEARSVGDEVHLSWSTASEENNDYFTIERSKDGLEIERLLQLPGAGNSNQNLEYSAIDQHPYSGISYYRLRQTDYDGNSTVTEWSLVNRSRLGVPSVACYFDAESEQLKLDLYITEDGPYHVQILDVAGRVIHNSSDSFSTGFYHTAIPLSALTSGIYFLHVTGATLNTAKPFLR